MEQTTKIKRDLWKICNKIYQVVDHVKFSFWEHYSIYDVKQTGYITTSIFKNVLNGPLQTIINLNDEEIQLLVNYFEKPNGQVQYGEFCQMIHNESNLNKELVTNEAINKNLNYTKQDLPRLNIMRQIANDLNIFQILLEPYFADYEEVTGNNGLMTIKQFKDMLYALKIQISPPEMQLIINKFIAYSYMIDKNQFFNELNWVKINDPQLFFTDVIINKDKLKKKNTRLYSNQNVFHPLVANETQKKDNIIKIIRNIQNYVFENRISIGQFFEPFDPYKKGYVNENQFRRCLDIIGIGSLHRLYYSEPELSLLVQMYKDKECPEKIRWKKFEDQINTVFIDKEMETESNVEIKCSLNVLDMLPIRGQDWEAVGLNIRKLFNQIIINIQKYLNQRRILLDQFFRVFDKNNHGHISRSGFRRAMFTAGIKCTEDELDILEKRLMNVNGFNYLEFLKIIKTVDDYIKQCSVNKTKNHLSKKVEREDNSLESNKKISHLTIAKLMTKIKTTVKRGRIKIYPFLNQFDTLNHKVMLKSNFQRALSMAGVNVDSNEIEILFTEFDSKTHLGHVNYGRFCDAVEEAFVTLGLERTPSAYPKEHLTTYEAMVNYLTDDERNAVDSALSKIRGKPNIGLEDLFKDYDRSRQGVVSMTEFLDVLTIRKLNILLSVYEIKCLMKAFSKDGRPPIAFNYRAFMKTFECD